MTVVEQPSILLVGDTRRREFLEADAAMERRALVTQAGDIETAAALLHADRVAPEVIVLAQDHPGQFTAEAIDRLRRAAPLSRVVVLLGSWCEGELRSGEPAPGVIRVYWHQWFARFDREWSHLFGGRSSAWSLPATATDEERLLAEDFRPAPHYGAIVVCAHGRDMRDWLAEACRRRGYATICLRPNEAIRVDGARAAILDATDAGPEEIAEIRRLAGQLAGTPIIVLLSFPRIEDHQRTLDAGAAAVLSKPLLVEDLYGRLEQAEPVGVVS